MSVFFRAFRTHRANRRHYRTAIIDNRTAAWHRLGFETSAVLILARHWAIVPELENGSNPRCGFSSWNLIPDNRGVQMQHSYNHAIVTPTFSPHFSPLFRRVFSLPQFRWSNVFPRSNAVSIWPPPNQLVSPQCHKIRDWCDRNHMVPVVREGKFGRFGLTSHMLKSWPPYPSSCNSRSDCAWKRCQNRFCANRKSLFRQINFTFNILAQFALLFGVIGRIVAVNARHERILHQLEFPPSWLLKIFLGIFYGIFYGSFLGIL